MQELTCYCWPRVSTKLGREQGEQGVSAGCTLVLPCTSPGFCLAARGRVGHQTFLHSTSVYVRHRISSSVPNCALMSKPAVH